MDFDVGLLKQINNKNFDYIVEESGIESWKDQLVVIHNHTQGQKQKQLIDRLERKLQQRGMHHELQQLLLLNQQINKFVNLICE